MKTICTALFLGLFAVAAHAQQGGSAAQQQRMKDCNAQASQKRLNGDERQRFASSCVATAAQSACSKRAGERKLKGDALRKFMTECLRG